jgi:hypothetical protein
MHITRNLAVLGAASALAAPSLAQLSNPVIGFKEAQLWAANAQPSDQLGAAVAVSGDRAVCGAPTHNPGGQSSTGAAWVFLRSAQGWAQEAKLSAADGLSDDRFGNAVAIDGSTIVVGAFRDDHANNGNAGSAYVFVRSGGAWVQQAKLIGSGVTLADYFGYSVDIQGDTAVIGAPTDEVGTPNSSGAVYVFTRSGGTWSQQAVLQASDKVAGDYFGSAVSISGNTIAVGASRDDDLGSSAGAAYVFVGGGASWTQQAQLHASDGETTDAFGTSIGISGDLIAVGAPYYDGGGTDSGVAYAYKRTGGAWTQESILVPAGSSIANHCGWSIDVDGSFALVGVPDDPIPGSTQGGSARLFRRSGATWSEETKIVHDDVRGRFGIAVSLKGDRLLVGAPHDSLGLPVGGQGSSYAFRLQNTPEIYCTAKENSKGCRPAIGFNGVPSATSAAPFQVTGVDVINNKLGYLLYGSTLENNAFQGGVLCIAAPILRTPVQHSGGNPPPEDCSGSFALDFNAWIQGHNDPGLVAGADVYAQWWSRDPSLGTTYPVSLSNAIHFAIQP